MTPERLKAIRHSHGLSLAELSDFLGIVAVDQVRFMEAGKKPISGPVSVVMEAMDRGYLDVMLAEFRHK